MTEFKALDGWRDDPRGFARRRSEALAEAQRQTALLAEIARVLGGRETRKHWRSRIFWQAFFEFRRYGKRIRKGT